MPDQIENLRPAANENQNRATNSLLGEYMALLTATTPLDAAARVGQLGASQRMNTLINDMDSPDWRTRERATAAVYRMGMFAAPYLAEALQPRTLSLEQKRRCEQALDHILGNERLPALVARLSNSRTPDYLQQEVRSHVRGRVQR